MVVKAANNNSDNRCRAEGILSEDSACSMKKMTSLVEDSEAVASAAASEDRACLAR